MDINTFASFGVSTVDPLQIQISLLLKTVAQNFAENLIKFSINIIGKMSVFHSYFKLITSPVFGAPHPGPSSRRPPLRVLPSWTSLPHRKNLHALLHCMTILSSWNSLCYPRPQFNRCDNKICSYLLPPFGLVIAWTISSN